jgi:hypothetical protein
MSSQSGEKSKLSRRMALLLTFVFLVWTAGTHAFPFQEDPSASSQVVDAVGITDSSSDGGSPSEEPPLQRFIAEHSPAKISSCALAHLAFDGPSLRLLSYPCLPQGPPATL